MRNIVRNITIANAPGMSDKAKDFESMWAALDMDGSGEVDFVVRTGAALHLYFCVIHIHMLIRSQTIRHLFLVNRRHRSSSPSLQVAERSSKESTENRGR